LTRKLGFKLIRLLLLIPEIALFVLLKGVDVGAASGWSDLVEFGTLGQRARTWVFAENV
jgi:hypothetical protein